MFGQGFGGGTNGSDPDRPVCGWGFMWIGSRKVFFLDAGSSHSTKTKARVNPTFILPHIPLVGVGPTSLSGALDSHGHERRWSFGSGAGEMVAQRTGMEEVGMKTTVGGMSGGGREHRGRKLWWWGRVQAAASTGCGATRVGAQLWSGGGMR